MKMIKKGMAAGAALMMAVTGMTMSASASIPDSWNLYASYGAPTSDRKTVDTGTVTELNPNNGDTGIRFHVQNYITSGTPCYALGEITTSGIAAGDKAYVNGTYTADTAHFSYGWYNKCYGTASYQITGYNFATSGYDSMSGYAD